MRIYDRASRGEKGANAVEFAIIAPVLIVLLFGIFESAYYFNRYMVMTTAARLGARRAAMLADNDSVQTEADTEVRDYLGRVDPASLANLQVTATASGDSPNRTVTVTVTRSNYQSITGLVPIPDTMRTRFTLRMEDQLD